MTQQKRLPQDTTIRKKPNYFYAIISVALVLFLLGLCTLFLINAQLLVRSFKEQINIMIELKPDTDQASIEKLQADLRDFGYVKSGSVNFTSKETAADLLRKDFGEDFLKLDFQNPLYDVVTFNLNADQMTPAFLKALKIKLKSRDLIHDVYYQENMIGAIADNIENVSWIALGIGALFLFAAVVLIHNTIRLALFANRFLIKNMQLVGASWGFISRPYLLKSVTNGLLSGIVACLFLSALLWWAQQDVPALKDIQDPVVLVITFIAIMTLGILISLSSTFYVVNKYLKMRVDDLY